MSVYANLENLGLELPPAPKPVAAYLPYRITGNLVFISGQLPVVDGQLLCAGTVPDRVPPDKAAAAARLCGLNLLAVLQDACDGDLNRVTQVVRLGIYVASQPDFTNQPVVANGVSELMVSVFGEVVGGHARAAVGSVSLPLGSPVEVEGMFEIRV